MANEIIKIEDEQKAIVSGVERLAGEYVVSLDTIPAGETFLRQIKSYEDDLKERKEEITRPLMNSLASVRDLFRPLETGLAGAKKTIKDKILAYQIESDEKARIEEERINKRVEKGTMRDDTAAGKLQKVEASKVKTNTRTVRKLSIIDESLIPRGYMVPDREAITKQLFAGNPVPGTILVEEKQLVIK